MQRVLSFQMARGFGESSEFVTKRMCFSFLFSVGFLCLLCGFLLGRFATERGIEFRAEKKRLELAGNGLESTEYLQHFFLHKLERASFDHNFSMNWETFELREDYLNRLNAILSNLSFVHDVTVHESCVTATARGSREPDRYVVLSASGKSIGIALELVKIFNEIHKEHNWKSRRTLVFCISSGSLELCAETLPTFMHSKIVAYIAIDGNAFQDSGHFIVSGSDIIQSIVFQAVDLVQHLYSYNNRLLSTKNWTHVTNSRLSLDIPHAVLSFANDSSSYSEYDYGNGTRQVILAQVLSQAVWRLSECLIIKWDTNYFNQTVSRALKSMSSPFELKENKENVQEALVRLLINVENLNKKIDATEVTNTLDTRILNDLLMDLDRALLCPDKKLESKTNWAVLLKLSHKPFNVIVTYLNEVVKCYEIAIKILYNG